jgi:hypothetical protein
LFLLMHGHQWDCLEGEVDSVAECTDGISDIEHRQADPAVIRCEAIESPRCTRPSCFELCEVFDLCWGELPNGQRRFKFFQEIDLISLVVEAIAKSYDVDAKRPYPPR